MSTLAKFPGSKALEKGFRAIVNQTDAAKKSIDGFSKTAVASISGVNTKITAGVAASNNLAVAINGVNSVNDLNAELLKSTNEELIQTVASQGNAGEAYDRAKESIIALNEQIDINKQKIAEQSEAVRKQAQEDVPKVMTAFQTWLDQSRDVTAQLSQMWANFFSGFAQGMGDAVASIAVDGVKAAAVLRDVMKSMAKSIISGLVQIGVQRAISALLTSTVTKTEAAIVGSSNVAQVFGGQFAAMSQAPFPINLTAPVVATTMAATAKAGIAAAAAVPAAAGGIFTSPTLALIGEAGPEAVIPLDRAGGGFGMGQQTIILEVDGEQLAQLVVPNMPDVLRAQFGATF